MALTMREKQAVTKELARRYVRERKRDHFPCYQPPSRERVTSLA
jgi:hypothetical protein